MTPDEPTHRAKNALQCHSLTTKRSHHVLVVDWCNLECEKLERGISPEVLCVVTIRQSL